MKILLLEDDFSYRNSIKDLLIALEYQVEDFEDGKEALWSIYERQYDLLLLDVRVPSIDGYEIAKRVKSDNMTIPIIFITSLSDIEDLSLGYELGCSDYIRKPFSLKELKYRINQALKSHYFHTTSEEIALPLGFFFHTKTLTVRKKEFIFSLTDLEKRALFLFVQNLGIALDISTLKAYVWDGKEVGDSDVRMIIKKLRDRLDRELIVSQRGVGYKIEKG